jgi:iron-sulfur cluster repair protein YtfE (RIC family)
MRNGSYEASNVDAIARKLPAARSILRGYSIDTSSGLSLRTAALAAGAEPDEVLAQVEARLRRLAARHVDQPREKYADERSLAPASR